MIPDTNVGGNNAAISEMSDDQKRRIFPPESNQKAAWLVGNLRRQLLPLVHVLRPAGPHTFNGGMSTAIAEGKLKMLSEI